MHIFAVLPLNLIIFVVWCCSQRQLYTFIFYLISSYLILSHLILFYLILLQENRTRVARSVLVKKSALINLEP